MKEVKLDLRVRIANPNISGEEIAALIARLIQCGVEDAQETLRNGEGDIDTAELATRLEISTQIAVEPRVLVVARDNGAEAFHDDGVRVALFNVDDHADTPEDVELPPASFQDLAEQAGVPSVKT